MIITNTYFKPHLKLQITLCTAAGIRSSQTRFLIMFTKLNQRWLIAVGKKKHTFTHLLEILGQVTLSAIQLKSFAGCRFADP
jgi:hypothetical protein